MGYVGPTPEQGHHHAYYFKGKDPDDLAQAVRKWMNLYTSGTHPRSDNMSWLTWEQSAERLKEILQDSEEKELYSKVV
jgi:glycosyltransferase involved in cell wall biosynthesis